MNIKYNFNSSGEPNQHFLKFYLNILKKNKFKKKKKYFNWK